MKGGVLVLFQLGQVCLVVVVVGLVVGLVVLVVLVVVVKELCLSV